MRSWKVKPFTLVIIIISVSFLIAAPFFLPGRVKNSDNIDLLATKPSEWTGIISIWDIPYVQTGKGSHISWINKCIGSFEKQFPGVFIDLRTMTAERLAIYLNGQSDGDFLPDMISIGVYDDRTNGRLLDLSPYFTSEELAKLHPLAADSVMNAGRLSGIPWMMGSYGIFVNKAMAENANAALGENSLSFEALDSLVRAVSHEKKSGRKTISYYGFCTYSSPGSRPLMSLIYQSGGNLSVNHGYNIYKGWTAEKNMLPADSQSMTYAKAFNLFAGEKRAGVMLGSSKVIYDNRRLRESGKGLELLAYPIPLDEGQELYQDQIASYGIMSDESDEKTGMCILFLKSLLKEENQIRLKDIGMFPVIQLTDSLYEDDDQMKVLEESLKRASAGPFGKNAAQAAEIWGILNSNN